MHPVELTGVGLDMNTGAPLIVLQERDEPHRMLPIFVGAPEATAIAIGATGQQAPQPFVHDVTAAIIDALDGSVDAIEVTGLQQGSFTAAIRLSGPSGDHRIDSRPSDALAIAVRAGAPILVDGSVLDEAGQLPDLSDDADEADVAVTEQLDDEMIDTEVESFRQFLDEIDPGDFTGDPTDDA